MTLKSEQTGWQEFLALCAKAKSAEELQSLFDLFLTLEEKEMLGKRILIVKALEEGKLTQRMIAKRFRVSIAQITRGSNALKIISPKLRKFLKNRSTSRSRWAPAL